MFSYADGSPRKPEAQSTNYVRLLYRLCLNSIRSTNSTVTDGMHVMGTKADNLHRPPLEKNPRRLWQIPAGIPP